MKNIRRCDWESLKPTVYGWGINDVNYKVHIKEELPKINGKRKQRVIFRCPYYADWYEMLRRCYGYNRAKKNPSYTGIYVCDEWKYLSNFIKWVDSQPNRDWVNCDLDKDFLSVGVKYYSPDTCCYLSAPINTFTLDCKKARGTLLIGVSFCTESSKAPYRATCSGGVSKLTPHIGMFSSELEAHKAWQAKKHEYACLLAEQQDDPRVADALRQRYSPDKDWTTT